MVSKVAESAQMLKEQYLKMRLSWLPSSLGGAFLLLSTGARSIIQLRVPFLSYLLSFWYIEAIRSLYL